MTHYGQTIGARGARSRHHAVPYAVHERRERTRAAVRAAAEVAAGTFTLMALWGSMVVLFAMGATR